MKRPPIRVLVADDSATLRTALIALLGEDPSLVVVGQAADGQEAVAKALSLRPDVITMDVIMPRLDGLGATAAIMAQAPARVLVVCSVAEEKQLDLSFRAMAAGALELIAKPAPGVVALRAWGKKVAEAVRLMAEVPVVRRHRSSPRETPEPGTEPALKPLREAKTGALKPGGEVRAAGRPARAHTFPAAGTIDVIACVASTGGPPALAILLAALPTTLPVPILIAQHIAEGFTAGLVRWFAQVSKLPVQIAVEGERPEPGVVYLPPDGCDLELGLPFTLHARRSTDLHCPSGNKLLASVARTVGARALGLVLTGMGDDGAQGLLALRSAGGQTYAQDQESSVVFGMPQVAHSLGAARALVPLERMARIVLDACSAGAPG